MRYSEIFGVLAIAALATAIPVRGHAANVSVDVNVRPPPVVEETAPPPREGYTWAHGYWDYDNNQHEWRKGHWERNHPGEHWRNGEWHEHEGHWTLERGRWDRD